MFESKNKQKLLRLIWVVATLITLLPGLMPPSTVAQTLEGRVESEDFRIHKPANNRIGREQPMQPSLDRAPVVDGNAFASAPLAGKVDDGQLKSSAVQSDDFARLPKGFDIGADKGSRELVLAWEKWHKQLAAAIYNVWNQRANSPGRAVMKITVWRNREIRAEFMNCSGDSSFRRSITTVFDDINGNPGLTFPSKSERQQVSFEAEYIAGTNVNPGYSWLKGDYEKINKEY